jgi:hypothetical protein
LQLSEVVTVACRLDRETKPAAYSDYPLTSAPTCGFTAPMAVTLAENCRRVTLTVSAVVSMVVEVRLHWQANMPMASVPASTENNIQYIQIGFQ